MTLSSISSLEEFDAALSASDATALISTAHAIRLRMHDPTVVTYSLDPIINYTNVCTAACSFCAFYRSSGHRQAYVLSRAALELQIDKAIAEGARGILIQGGLHPQLTLDWYVDLLESIKRQYGIHLHCFSAPEILNIATLSGLSTKEVLHRLKDAGMDSLPGAGAEILHDEVRSSISRRKCGSADWLSVHRSAHQLGLPSSATMMFGCGETSKHLYAHFTALRDLQNETGGFTAFIPWPFQPTNTLLARVVPNKATADRYIRIVALSRIMLDNIQNVQVSWPTMGLQVASQALEAGANDFGSVLLEEHVLSAAGTRVTATASDIRKTIESSGFRPIQRDAVYSSFVSNSQ